MFPEATYHPPGSSGDTNGSSDDTWGGESDDAFDTVSIDWDAETLPVAKLAKTIGDQRPTHATGVIGVVPNGMVILAKPV